MIDHIDATPFRAVSAEGRSPPVAGTTTATQSRWVRRPRRRAWDFPAAFGATDAELARLATNRPPPDAGEVRTAFLARHGLPRPPV